MKNKRQNIYYFKEVQLFANSPVKWIYPLIFLLSVGPLVYGLYQQLVVGIPWGNHPGSNEELVMIFAFVFVFIVLLGLAFFKSRLEVTIDSEGIHYRFPVFVRKWRILKKDQIIRYEVRKYAPFLEYGGYGPKTRRHGYRRIKNGIAYNVSGKTGLQLYFANGKKMLIGTQRPAAIERAMRRLMEGEQQVDE